LKRTITYLFIAVMIIAVDTSCKWNNGLPSLKETFSAEDKIPFGTYVCRKQLAQFYYHNTILDKNKNFAKTLQDISDTGSIYICISKNLFLSKKDKQAMLNYVSAGNSLFISSSYIDEDLLTELHCTESREAVASVGMNYTSEAMDTSAYNDQDKYGYYYFPFRNYFSGFDSSASTILGKNENGLVDFIIVYYGKGRFYLHCEPRAFSNYFLLQKNNYHYLQNAFSYTSENPDHVFWDDHYNKHNFKDPNDDGNGALSVLLHYPPMAWAFWLALSLLLLYVLFGGKRRQRIIKVIPPNTNTTVAFTETVGRLYYQQKDNKNIADKMITYLLEHIRNQYFLNTNQLNDTFIETLSRKSSISKDIMEGLFKTIIEIRQGDKVTDEQLLSFNQQIGNFYKNKI
jgi:hypothetical protein